MGQRVAVAKVAKALGLDRAVLRHRIESAGIDTFEGTIDLDELRRIAPMFGADGSDVLERLRLIRENARELRHDPSAPPPAEDLAQQVRSLTVGRLIEKKRAEEARGLIEDLVRHLEALLVSQDPVRREVAMELNEWLARRLRPG
ncbi:MAG: hypothetical protein ABT940_07730 [Alphaproteobacteria bacterium]